VFASRYRAAITAEMIGIIVRYRSRIRTVAFRLLLPCARKLRTAITTGKITSIIKIDFNITGYDIILVSG
jgi:hypothetical protein